MKPCPKCGLPVRLGAVHVRVNNHRGVTHYIAHVPETNGCDSTEGLVVTMFKPYPKVNIPYVEMIALWEGL